MQENHNKWFKIKKSEVDALVNEKELVNYYLDLDRHIFDLEKKQKRKRQNFYAQTMNSFVTTNEIKIYSQDFAVEENVINFVYWESESQKNIEVLKFKRDHLERYLARLGNRWKKIPRIALYDEFMEIEEAAARHFNLYDPDEPPEETEADYY